MNTIGAKRPAVACEKRGAGHNERAKAAGARVLAEPEDGAPGRRYRGEDCEGHRWMFMEHGGVGIGVRPRLPGGETSETCEGGRNL